MKKLLVILSLILLMGVAMGSGITRTSFIKTGYTMLSTPFTCTALDTITTGETYTILITNLQQFQQHQQFYFDLTDVSGSANSVVITAYGKVTAGGAYVQIGSPITWTSNTQDGYITSTTPINYNYFKIELVADGSTQKNLLARFEVKTANAAAIPANSGLYTFGRATSGSITLTSQDDNANCDLIVGAGGTGALTLGDAGSTTAITSSDWAIGATGIMTGIGAITADGLITANGGVTLGGADDLVGSSTSSILFNTNKFTVAGATGNTVVGGTLGVTGIMTLSATPVFQNGESISNATDGSFIIPNIIRKHTPVAFNSTGTLSADNMLAGVISCTSTSAVAMTTPTATAIAALISGAGAGTAFDLIIDNTGSSSSGVVTLTLDGSITVVNPAIITGGATLTLAIATTAKFSFYFTSATAAKVYRVY